MQLCWLWLCYGRCIPTCVCVCAQLACTHVCVCVCVGTTCRRSRRRGVTLSYSCPKPKTSCHAKSSNTQSQYSLLFVVVVEYVIDFWRRPYPHPQYGIHQPKSRHIHHFVSPMFTSIEKGFLNVLSIKAFSRHFFQCQRCYFMSSEHMKAESLQFMQ
jgi:hypothetical protein